MDLRACLNWELCSYVQVKSTVFIYLRIAAHCCSSRDLNTWKKTESWVSEAAAWAVTPTAISAVRSTPTSPTTPASISRQSIFCWCFLVVSSTRLNHWLNQNMSNMNKWSLEKKWKNRWEVSQLAVGMGKGWRRWWGQAVGIYTSKHVNNRSVWKPSNRAQTGRDCMSYVLRAKVCVDAKKGEMKMPPFTFLDAPNAAAKDDERGGASVSPFPLAPDDEWQPTSRQKYYHFATKIVVFFRVCTPMPYVHDYFGW